MHYLHHYFNTRYIWSSIAEAESTLEKLHEDCYGLFAAWIYSLKSIFASYIPNVVYQEIDRCILQALKFYNGIANRSEQVWLLRDLEHLHFILTKSHAQINGEKASNFMLDVLCNIIMQMSPSEEKNEIKSEPISAYTINSANCIAESPNNNY